MRKISFFLFILFSIYFFVVNNQRFRPSKIYFPVDWITTDTSTSTPNFLSNCKFRYLSKGRQSYVFETEDSKYVIKFLRYDKLRKPLWTSLSPFSSLIAKERQKKDKKLKAWERCFTQVENLPLDLGLVYSHLSNEKGVVTLLDKTGKPYLLDIQNTRFFIQKKVTLLKDSFFQHNPKKLIELFFQSIVDRINKNIINKTSSCMENVGLIEDTIIEYDFGEVYEMKEGFEKKKHFLSFTDPLKGFLESRLPLYVPFFEQKRNEYLEMIHE
ncbi:MAG: hypothetical protein PVI40_01040 [Chlamydiota bacterium]|jgi:hypothetical protein